MKNRLGLTTLLIFTSTLLMSCNSKKDDSSNHFSMSIEGYTLNQTVILSRHNIRSPLSGNGSLLDKITPYKWHEWSSGPSELSIKGGLLETEMGQYFRKWFEKEKLFTNDYQPSEEEIRIYANAKQRTIATSNYFSAGLMPSYNLNIEVNAPFNSMDPVFNPQLTFISDSYIKAAKEEIDTLFLEKIKGLKDNYTLLSDVIDFRNSEAYKNKEISNFKVDDTAISLELNKEPSMTGSLKNGCSAADALVLQYYEELDSYKAGFNHNLSFNDWKNISEIKDLYGDVLFTAPKISSNVAHPLLLEIQKELNNDNRKFSFLCGHDSNLCSVLSSLEVEDYHLINAIESKTPIGSKIVINSFNDTNGKEFYSVNMVYQSVEQLRNVSILDLEHSPMIVPLKFKGVDVDENGLCSKDSFLEKLNQSILKYDELKQTYGCGI